MTLLSGAEAQQIANTAILRQLTEGVIVTDVVGTIKFINDAAATLHGVSELNVRPNAYAETYHLYTEDGRPYPTHELPLARAVRGEMVKNARWRIRRPDGTNVLAIGNAQPIYGLTGQRIGAILTLRDDTARDTAERASKSRETALREANAKLAERAAALSDQTSKINSALDDLLGRAEILRNMTVLDDARSQGETIHKTVGLLKAMLMRLNDSTDCSASVGEQTCRQAPPPGRVMPDRRATTSA